MSTDLEILVNVHTVLVNVHDRSLIFVSDVCPCNLRSMKLDKTTAATLGGSQHNVDASR